MRARLFSRPRPAVGRRGRGVDAVGTPGRPPAPERAVHPSSREGTLRREWFEAWAGGGAVTGEPSWSLGGTDSSGTLVPRERKRRDSQLGSGDNYRSAERCGLTYVSMIHRR